MKLFVLGAFFSACAGCYPYFSDYHAPMLRQECPSLSIRCYKDDLYQELYHVAPILKVNKEFIEMKDQNKVVFAIGLDQEKMEEEKTQARKELGEGARFLALIPEEAHLEMPQRYREGVDVTVTHFDQSFDFSADPLIERFPMDEGFLVTLTFGTEGTRDLFVRKVMSETGLPVALSFKFYASELQGQWKLIVSDKILKKIDSIRFSFRQDWFWEFKGAGADLKVEQFDPSFIDKESIYLYSVRAFFHHFYTLYGSGGWTEDRNHYEKKNLSHENSCLFDRKKRDVPIYFEGKTVVVHSIEEKMDAFFRSLNFVGDGSIDEDYYVCDSCFRRAWRKHYPEIGPTVQMTHINKPAPDDFLFTSCYRSHRFLNQKPGPVTLDVYATYPITSETSVPVVLSAETISLTGETK